MNIWLLAAGGLSVINTLLHIFAGGPSVARPLLDARDLSAEVRYVNYYCWHLVSINLAAVAALFLWPAWSGEAEIAAILATGLAAAYAIWGLVLPVLNGQRYKDIPQGFLFVPVTILGIVGLSFQG
ncbi:MULTISPECIES: hypothetical protein [Phaeobacter]|uniref:DUF423 domain-containing protein n=1 Tax=Phaeobacter piscinae TaxID=1580596 RepID=A0ABM6PFN7_9RHOB|nr:MULTISPECIES: hypothetical protein [Phaeobacter]ATG36602.1 hypothetical protein PhaeoP36_02490 [Phaeobacter piscinae]AUQ87123.1 hypothetical protein PhaeoP42_02491 [Phaeobacter piscinae]AUR25006.1 hypothetical protein PhaeoP23_02490 [Phaeobacter piscinae]KII16011.1 hypothetical protein OO25_08380 [Phaeobacter sp. S60]UTS81514.1 hypothetical protein OL67_002600 [Phaeobacter piscinae]